MPLSSVAGRSANTAATANHVGAQLWNPHSTARIWVVEISYVSLAAVVSNPSIIRSSARGATPTTTVTPDIDNVWERDIAPPSGSVLELATFGTQPTLAGPALKKWNTPAAIGSGFLMVFPSPGIAIPPGTGLCIATEVAVILQAADITFTWTG